MSGHLVGKTALVTGATSGIGFHTALGLARDGAHVILGGRDEERARKSVEVIRRETEAPRIDYLIADMSSMAGVRSFAEQVLNQYSRLDILVNNVGGLFLTRQISEDGYEKTFALNHLSYFLLTELLNDLLIASAPARIVNVSSTAHLRSRINFEDLQSTRRYRAMTAYGQSKLANLLFTYELARRLADTGVTANALHPGFVRTALGRKNANPVLGALIWLVFRAGMSAEYGARTSLLLAGSPGLEEVTGKYYSAGNQVRSSRSSYDKAAAAKLWDLSEELTGLR
ncbi:MAG: SDR family oxidoreductase [Chloroflexi bacterium]|nr:SDR family oxidoreductase [Chloroflexota bacterium]MCH8338407.1 SDR family oxidoreductase [Chloroflexota bacterium]